MRGGQNARGWIHDHWLDWSGRLTDRAAGLLLRARLALAEGHPKLARDHAQAALDGASVPRQPLALQAAREVFERLGAGSSLERADDIACRLPS